jgi:hypothetical protein
VQRLRVVAGVLILVLGVVIALGLL